MKDTGLAGGSPLVAVLNNALWIRPGSISALGLSVAGAAVSLPSLEKGERIFLFNISLLLVVQQATKSKKPSYGSGRGTVSVLLPGFAIN